MKTAVYVEGRTRLIVPKVSLEVIPPPTSPVFFNPAARLNRDVTVAITDGTEGGSFCDSMAGTGARGIRVAREAKGVREVTMVDFNRAALGMAKKAAALNRVAGKCEFAEAETSSFLFSRYGREKRFDYVDVDPFGTPIGQLQAALRATADGGILSVTATDTAVLCGVYPEVARRRYGGTSLNNQFNHETAIRLLAGAVARIGASIDIGTRPLASHSTRHYVRLYIRVFVGASQADGALEEIGHVVWCPACGEARESGEEVTTCQACGKKAKPAGPLWVGGLTEPGVLRSAERSALKKGLSEAAKVLRSQFGSDDFPPWSFSLERISSLLGVVTAPEGRVRARLKELGFSSMRTPYEKTGIKTDADYKQVVDTVKTAVGEVRGGRELRALPTARSG